jgi:hypothetical protein
MVLLREQPPVELLRTNVGNSAKADFKMAYCDFEIDGRRRSNLWGVFAGGRLRGFIIDDNRWRYLVRRNGYPWFLNPCGIAFSTVVGRRSVASWAVWRLR